MVLEKIVSPFKAEKKPREVFVLGLACVLVGSFLGFVIFPGEPSIPAVFLSTIACIPFTVKLLTIEEKEEFEKIEETDKLPLIKSHFDVLEIFGYLFAGFLVGFLLLYIGLPSNLTNLLFEKQIETITEMGASGPTTNAIIGGKAIEGSTRSMKVILFNNLRVLTFCILFSFLYGAGAIFILIWNASVISTAIGNFVKLNIGNLGSATHIGAVSAYFKALPMGLAKYLIHGIPEIVGYFFAGIAGGIISAAVIRSDYKSEEFYEIVIDSIDLISIAILLLIIGALFEVGVTPAIVS